jgi:hypothetical protein
MVRPKLSSTSRPPSSVEVDVGEADLRADVAESHGVGRADDVRRLVEDVEQLLGARSPL